VQISIAYLMVQETQREFFHILDEFFHRATGKSAEEFSEPSRFGDTIRNNVEGLARRCETALPWLHLQLMDFYNRDTTRTFIQAQQCGGLKLVLGGNSRFGESQFDAVRKMLLYADTILIPDPILPWVEVQRPEEEFRDVRLLEAVFQILPLKPLVDADLQYPAVVIFGSFEKSLEATDLVTQRGALDLQIQVLSFKLGHKFESLQDVTVYVKQNGDTFLEEVERNALFMGPGTKGTPKNLKQEIEAYLDFIRTWRSPQFVQRSESLSPAELVLQGICERINPQWHLMENAEELHAHPMLCLNAHWYYFKLCAEVFEGRLVQADLLQPQTMAIIQALQQPSLRWLGNVPVEALVDLRCQGENEEFRKRLSEFTTALHESRLEDLDRVASEIARGIQSLLAEHQHKVQLIEDKYKYLYEDTATKAWTTAGALLLPVLAPMISPLIPPVTGAAALGLAGKYVRDKLGEIREKKQLSKSLTGVLASAAHPSQR
jgi:hypothetical protein